MSTLVLVDGPTASGKTTYIARHAPDALRLTADGDGRGFLGRSVAGRRVVASGVPVDVGADHVAHVEKGDLE